MGRSRIGGQPPGESDVHGPALACFQVQALAVEASRQKANFRAGKEPKKVSAPARALLKTKARREKVDFEKEALPFAGAEATATQIKNELRNKTLALERVQRHSGPTTIQVMSDSEAKLDRLFYVESPKTSYLIADN
ncbi:hypothetical protein Tco_0290715 [Tanacetum coccineum]